ncbi:DegT/DnrJ/EryC1/StrS family aminotransferase [Parapedobacter sp. 10938]|uniref:DegT/DnrJ/EryC1/StrS family aminotransferase n=1 Tax=Parapedobacter flavus TaxID=3110225 RepID=UPI002DC010F8|nr:DegT/DnrJ/EryC1/StrS family aminotransferase [Parapedobacter sp. 10938]MEC3878302.1 DegT/DnrJ/EryC1/StrS family aminotransferase [Parapedobacter sp. 10938]
MKNNRLSRRGFIGKTAMMGAGIALAPSLMDASMVQDKPAILGGKAVRNKPWAKWPLWKPETDEKRLLEVMRSGVWSRNKVVAEFEQAWANATGAKRCLTVVNGTNALITAMVQLGIGAGDEVILSPYTFIACSAAILATGAIPIFVDVDRETFQIDPAKIEERITDRTRAIMAIHILGLPCDMPAILDIARKHDLLVLEDACQAWLAEINGQKVGTFGNAGCFSFQNSKSMAIGEGGAIVSNDDRFMDRCFSYHNFGTPYGTVSNPGTHGPVMMGTKLRLTEYQAAIGLSQLTRLEEETRVRTENANYLHDLIKEIPGIMPYRLYDHVTRAVFFLFPFRYQQNQSHGLTREGFIEALRAEGIPCSSGYAPLNKMPYLAHAFQTKNFKRMYTAEELDIDVYNRRNHCPENDALCDKEAVWFTQNMLLGPRSDMEEIAFAMERIQRNAARIAQQR